MLAGTAFAVLLADQLTKAAVRAWLPLGRPVWLLDHVLSLNHVENTGAAFSLLVGHREVFIAATLAVLAGVVWAWFKYRPDSVWLVVGLGLLIGGALGNLIDRAVIGSVTDFVDFQVWPVFNVADSCVDIGVGIIVAWLLLAAPKRREPDGDMAPADASADADAPADTDVPDGSGVPDGAPRARGRVP